jgi:ATP-dependent DNA ligase
MSFYETKTAKALGKAKVKTDGITNPEILSLLQNYRQSVASAYSPVSPDDISDQIPKGEAYVSKKIDGELWFLIKEGKDLALSNSKGKVIFGDFPILKEAKTSLKASSGLNIIAGELYLDNGGKRTRASYLSKSMGGGAKAKLDSIRFTAFDVLCADDKTFAIDEYIEKSDYLNSFFKGNKGF